MLEGVSTDQALAYLRSGGDAPTATRVLVRDSVVIGGAQLRHTPMNAFDLFGGVPETNTRAEACALLLRDLRADVNGASLSTYASTTHWDLDTLEALGFVEVATYERFRAA